jgi:hypothetical protein
MGFKAMAQALGSIATKKRKYSKAELAAIEAAREALADWGVECARAGPAEVEALYVAEQQKVRIYVDGTDPQDTKVLLGRIAAATGSRITPDTARVATGVLLLEAADVKFVRLPVDPRRWRAGAAAILFVTSFSSVDGLDEDLERYGRVVQSFAGVAVHLVANTRDFEVYGLKDTDLSNYDAAKQYTLDRYRRLSDAQGRVFYNHALDFEEQGTVGTFVDALLEVTMRQLLEAGGADADAAVQGARGLLDGASDDEDEGLLGATGVLLAGDEAPPPAPEREPVPPVPSHAEQVARALANLPPLPPPDMYPLRVVVEESSTENEVSGKMFDDGPGEDAAAARAAPEAVETTGRVRKRFEESLYKGLVEKGMDAAAARARARDKAAALPARVAKPASFASPPAKGEARRWRAGGLEIRSPPADA